MIIAKYKFDSSIYPNYLPELPSGYTYSITDSQEGSIITRTLESDTAPTSVRFGTGNDPATNREKCLLEVSVLDISQVTSFLFMFRYCSSLQSIDTSNWDTSKVTNMFSAFQSCESLQSLDVSNWDTSQVNDMTYAFLNCYSLQSLDVSNWDTSKVTIMRQTFSGCSKLQYLDVSNWKTGSVTNMQQTFQYCSKLQSLDLSKWDTSKVTNISDTFAYCSSLQSLDVSTWDISKVTTMHQTFYNCTSLQSLDVSNWDTSSVTSMYQTFCDCSSLQSLDLSNWDTSSLTNMESTFKDCSSLQSLDVSNWNTSKVTNMHQTFQYCSKLQSLDLSKWDTSKVTTMQGIFYGCSSLQSLDLSKWDTCKVTNMTFLFYDCSKLQFLDVSTWDTGLVTNMRAVFYGCSSLQSLDLSNWDTGLVKDMGYTFQGCSSLQSLDVSNWDTSSVTTMYYTFQGCSSLQSLDLSNWNTSKVDSLYQTFLNCSSLQSLDLSNWNTSKVTDMRNTFSNHPKLHSLGLVYCDIPTIQAIVDILPNNNINIYIDKNINMSSINLTKNNLIHYDCEFIKVPLPEPLRAVGTSRDKIVEIDNKYYIRRECAVIQPTSLGVLRTYSITDADMSHVNHDAFYQYIRSSHVMKFKSVLYSYGFTFTFYGFKGTRCFDLHQYNYDSCIAITLPCKSKKEANKYIIDNNISILYELAEPIYEEIDIPTLELLSKQGYTLSVDSNIPTPLSLDCLNITYPQTLQPSTKYLIIFDSNALITCDISLGGSTLKNCNVQLGTNVFAITTSSAISDNLLRFSANNFNVYNINSPTSSFSISSHDISYDELIVLLNSLQVVYTEQILTLGSINRTKLTDADILIAVEKGWTIV